MSTWRQIGQNKAWKGTQAAAVSNGLLYSVDDSGRLWATHPGSGEYQELSSQYGTTDWLVDSGEGLYGIDRAGSLFRVFPDGSWKTVDEGDWDGTRLIAGADGFVYTVDEDGGLYATHAASVRWALVGGAHDYGDTQHLAVVGGLVYTIESDGTLYQTDPRTGAWKQVGDEGAWEGTIAIAGAGRYLYSVDGEGGLYATDPHAEDYRTLDEEYDHTEWLFTGMGKVYTIERDGTLYETAP
jgi:hypothetical protein